MGRARIVCGPWARVGESAGRDRAVMVMKGAAVSLAREGEAAVSLPNLSRGASILPCSQFG